MMEMLPLLEGPHSGRFALHPSLEMQSILDLALSEIKRMLKARQAFFFFYDKDSQLRTLGPEEPPAGLFTFARTCVDRWDDLIYNPDGSAESISGLNFATLGVPLTSHNDMIGVIVVSDPLFFSHFYDSDLSLLKLFSATFAILLRNTLHAPGEEDVFLRFRTSLLLLLENVNLHQKMRESEYQLKTVLEVSNLINSSRELTEMIQTILYSARRVTNAESASLFLVDEETGDLYFDIIANKEGEELKGMRIPRGQGIAGLCAMEKRSIIVNDAQKDSRVYKHVDEVSSFVTRNILATPLLVDGRIVGVIESINTIDRPAFSDHDREIFESFSDSIAIAIQRRRLLDDLQRTNLKLEKNLREVTILHAVAGALVEARSIHELFSHVLRIIRRDLNVGRISILMYDRKEELEIVALESEQPIVKSDQSTSSLSEQVLQLREPVFIEDFRRDERFSSFFQPGRYSSSSCILIPLRLPRIEKPFGLLCASEPLQGKFVEADYRLLITITSQMVRGYENFILSEQILANREIEKEVEITSRIQKNILPDRLPQHLHVDIAADSIMARTTGGDFYDYYVRHPNGDVIMLVADVSGKSLPAAIFMAISNSILRTIIRSEMEPEVILQMANELIYEESQSGMFVTVFLAHYNPASGLLKYASAGQNDMLLVNDDGSYRLLSGKGSPLGVLPRQRYSGGQIEVDKSDVLILYTDGVTEAVDPENEEFGLDRLVGLIRENRSLPPQKLIEKIYSEVVSFSNSHDQYDDFTMLVADFKGIIKGRHAYASELPAAIESVPLLRDFILEKCQRHGMAGRDLEDILLVADEAATNIVIHAYAGLSVVNPVFYCDLEIETGQKVRLQFRDNGRSFRMEDVKHPDLSENLAGKRKGGFGVYLIRSLMDLVSYYRKDEQNYLVTEKLLNR